ncbi:MAG: alanine racemase [Planctomycetota bacterium]
MISERAWAEIDLGALRNNISQIRNRIPAACDVMLVIKADAYGHGMKIVASAAQQFGIQAFGVRDSREALELREIAVRQRILVLGTVIESEVEKCLEQGIELAIHATDRVRSLRQLVKRLGHRLHSKPRVHLNVDTGMGRLGLPVESAPKVLDAILAAENELELVGIMTHLARPEGGAHEFTIEQCARFQQFLNVARTKNVKFATRPGEPGARIHIANSAAVFAGLNQNPILAGGQMVRPGIAAYGVMPRDVAGADSLQPVMSLRAQIAFLKDVSKGTSISYGQEWIAPAKTRIATVPIGYYDGIPWRVKGKGVALVRGQRARIVGRITMDYVMLDITKIPNVHVGDTVTFFGKDGDAYLPVEEIAKSIETIPYEITCLVGTRVKRIAMDTRIEPKITEQPLASV